MSVVNIYLGDSLLAMAGMTDKANVLPVVRDIFTIETAHIHG